MAEKKGLSSSFGSLVEISYLLLISRPIETQNRDREKKNKKESVVIEYYNWFCRYQNSSESNFQFSKEQGPERERPENLSKVIVNIYQDLMKDQGYQRLVFHGEPRSICK